MVAKLLNVSKFNSFCNEDMVKYTSFKTVIWTNSLRIYMTSDQWIITQMHMCTCTCVV